MQDLGGYSDKELEVLFESLLDKDEVISEYRYIDGDFLYVRITNLTRKNWPKNHDRYGVVGGKGPIKLNLKTKEFERIRPIDFPTKFYEEYNPTIKEIINGIIERKYLNVGDVFNFIKIHYPENENIIDNRPEMIDSPEGLLITVKDKDFKKEFISFLKQTNLKYYFLGEETIALDRVIK